LNKFLPKVQSFYMDDTEILFSSFQKELRKSSLKVYREAGYDKLKDSKRKNEELLSSLISMEEKIQNLEASTLFIQNLQAPVRINLQLKDKGMLQGSSENFDSPLLSQNDDMFKEILDQIDLTTNEDEEYLNLILKRKKLIQTQKSLLSPDFNDLVMANLFDENNNLEIEKFKLKDEVEPRLTRRKRKTSGGSIVDPRKFYVCLICGDRHMDYSIQNLKRHYRSSHGYDIGPGPLPETKSQLDETITKDRQKSTVCHLCKTVFDNLDDLVLHKSLHVNPKFCRHKCSVEDCQEGFVLKEHLENHQMVHET